MLENINLAILSQVNRLNLTNNLHSFKRQNLIVLATLLLAAQLFSQLHAIEHLEYAGTNGHNNQVCQLCILGSGLDAGNIDTISFATHPLQTPQLELIPSKSFTSNPLTSSQIRAPPFFSSIK